MAIKLPKKGAPEPTAQAKRDEHAEAMKAIHGAFNPAPNLVPTYFPDFIGMQRTEEIRRIRQAQAEGEAKATAEFKTRQELEAAHRKEQQATAVTVPPPAPATESIADRDARWLAMFDQEDRKNRKGAQARTCRMVFEQEGVPPDTVKKALQKAKTDRLERYRQDGAIPLPKKKGKAVNVATSAFNWRGLPKS